MTGDSSAAPGLSLPHISEAAWQHIAANPRAPAGPAVLLSGWRDAHLRSFPYTPPIAEIHALHSCLEQYLAEGPDAVLARHRAAARAARAGRHGPGPLGDCTWKIPFASEAFPDFGSAKQPRTESDVSP
jgi:aspartate aminotransferase-like enzyme